MLSVASTDGCCAGAKLAVIAPRPASAPNAASPASASASPPTSSSIETASQLHSPHAGRQALGDAQKPAQIGAGETRAAPSAAPSFEDCSWFVPDLQAQGTEHPQLSILLQALGAVATRADSFADVEAAKQAARARTNALSASDFSFLTDLDEESESASMTFDVGALGVPLALARVQLVIQVTRICMWAVRGRRCA